MAKTDGDNDPSFPRPDELVLFDVLDRIKDLVGEACRAAETAHELVDAAVSNPGHRKFDPSSDRLESVADDTKRLVDGLAAAASLVSKVERSIDYEVGSRRDGFGLKGLSVSVARERLAVAQNDSRFRTGCSS